MEPIEQRISNTIKSIENLDRASLSEDLKNKIVSTAIQQKSKNIIRPNTKWLVAASITLLIGLNLFSVIQYKKQRVVKTEQNAIYYEYFDFIRII